jgi:MscS family membrane protein
MKRILGGVVLMGMGRVALGAEARIGPRAGDEVSDWLERCVNWLHGLFPAFDLMLFHWLVCGILFCAAIMLRRAITNFLFYYLRKLAAQTETTLDDKLFPALERPTATLVMVGGVYAALTVLALSPEADRWVVAGAKLAALSVLLWGMIRAGGAILDHLGEIAHEKDMTVATFMPLIKKTLLVFGVIFGVLVIAQSQGLPVQSFLAGLGIGGLAFALAAQETLANFFGSLVVVMDQPFKVGDVVRIGANEGTVEDIGLRSTKIRTAARTVIVIPNKSVAGESITNFTRMPQRRVDQTLGLTYDTTAEQLAGVLGDLRAVLRDDGGVHPETMVVNFANYGASSLEIQIVWFAVNPDWVKHMEVRERINLQIMRVVAARGLSFAFPTQTLHVPEPLLRALVVRPG